MVTGKLGNRLVISDNQVNVERLDNGNGVEYESILDTDVSFTIKLIKFEGTEEIADDFVDTISSELKVVTEIETGILAYGDVSTIVDKRCFCDEKFNDFVFKEWYMLNDFEEETSNKDRDFKVYIEMGVNLILEEISILSFLDKLLDVCNTGEDETFTLVPEIKLLSDKLITIDNSKLELLEVGEKTAVGIMGVSTINDVKAEVSENSVDENMPELVIRLEDGWIFKISV